MEKTKQVEEIISQINQLHADFFQDYFERGRIEKINLSKTIRLVSEKHIFHYRLSLHESINDYLMRAMIHIKYFYRVKTRESIEDKINRYAQGENQYPVNNWMNDQKNFNGGQVR